VFGFAGSGASVRLMKAALAPAMLSLKTSKARAHAPLVAYLNAGPRRTSPRLYQTPASGRAGFRALHAPLLEEFEPHAVASGVGGTLFQDGLRARFAVALETSADTPILARLIGNVSCRA
jgi:hypothetical protein